MSQLPQYIAAARFEQVVQPQLRRLLRRIRLYVALEGSACVAVALLICFFLQIGIDWIFRLRVDLRAALLAGVLAIVALTLWRKLLQPLIVAINIEDVAEVIEGQFPQVESRLISAVQFVRGRLGAPESNSPSLINRVIEQAEIISHNLPLNRILNHRRARRHAGAVCSISAFFVVTTLLAPDAMGTWFDRNILLGNTTWKQYTRLLVLNDADGDGVIYSPRGDDLEIRVQVEGVRPRQVRIDLRFESGESNRQTMTAVGPDEFRFTVPKLNEPLSFSVRGGDARKSTVWVIPVDRPRITNASITIYPPAYTQLPPYELHPGKTLIEVLHGGEVEIKFRTNKELTKAVLLRDQSETGVVHEEHGGYWVRFRPDQNAAYSFELTDEIGLHNRRPRQFSVRMLLDPPPSVSLRAEGIGELVTAQADLSLAVQFKDRYGLAGAELIYQLVGETTSTVSIAVEQLVSGAKQLTTTRELRLTDLGAEEGTQLLLHAEAQDLNDVTGPGVGSSAKYAFRIVSLDDLLAELSRREQEFRQEFERLIDMQEKLRNDFLSAAGAFQRNPTRASRSVNFAALERRQRQISRQVAHVRSQFQRIHGELVINRLDSTQARDRLVAGIVQPLEVLATRTLAAAADQVEALRQNPSQAMFGSVDRKQAAILEDMRHILSNMTRWEGFHETISLLQSIIKLQKDLMKETDAVLNQELEELFGTEENQETEQ